MAVYENPWYVQDNTDQPYGQLRVDSDGEGCVCVVGTNDDDYTVGEDRREIARLIASAPALLEVARELLLRRCMDGYTPENCSLVRKAAEVINKAEGRD